MAKVRRFNQSRKRKIRFSKSLRRSKKSLKRSKKSLKRSKKSIKRKRMKRGGANFNLLIETSQIARDTAWKKWLNKAVKELSEQEKEINIENIGLLHNKYQLKFKTKKDFKTFQENVYNSLCPSADGIYPPYCKNINPYTGFDI